MSAEENPPENREPQDIEIPGYQFKAVATVGKKRGGWENKKTVDSKYGPNDEVSASSTGDIKTFIVFGYNMDTDLTEKGPVWNKLKEAAKLLRETGEDLVVATDHLLMKLGVDYDPALKDLREGAPVAPQPQQVATPTDPDTIIDCRQCNKQAMYGSENMYNKPLCDDHIKLPSCACCFGPVTGTNQDGKPYMLCGSCNARVESRKQDGMEFIPACDDLRLKLTKEFEENRSKEMEAAKTQTTL